MVQNPYGLRNNNPSDWVNVRDVDRSSPDEYFCAECGGKLIPVQPSNPKKQWFFRHAVESNCEGSRETAIHLMAKQILLEERRIMLPYMLIKPEPHIYIEYKSHKQVRIYQLGSRKLFQFDSVQDEVWHEGRIPDIVAVSGDRKLFIEICVTHGIDADKLSWIQEQNISTLSVNLSGLSRDASKADVRKCLLTGWLHNMNIMNWTHHAKKLDHQQRANEHYVQQVLKLGLGPKGKKSR